MNNLGFSFAIFETISNLYKSLPQINIGKMLPDINIGKFLQPQSEASATGTGDFDVTYQEIFNWFVNAGVPPENIQSMWVETWLSEAKLVGKTYAYKELVAGWQTQARNAVLSKVFLGLGVVLAGYLAYKTLRRK